MELVPSLFLFGTFCAPLVPLTPPVLLRRMSYLIAGSAGLHQEFLRVCLEKLGLTEALNVTSVTYLHVELTEGVFDHSTYEVKSRVKNVLRNEKRNITSKDRLSVNKRLQEWLAPTRNLSQVENLKEGEVLILKPVGTGAYGGKDIVIVTNTTELLQAKKRLLQRYKSAVACQYIRNPLLFQGKKFHLRTYVLVNTQREHHVAPFGKILTAKLPYQDGDFSNKAIHDTHLDSTETNWFYPEDLEVPALEKSHLMREVEKVLHMIGESVPALSYQESKYAYEVFGVDLLITNEYRVVLLEVNEKVGYDFVDERGARDFSSKYYSWVVEKGVKPLL